MLKAVIFDYDGVIINTDKFHIFTLVESFKKKGFKFDEAQYKTVFAGKTLKEGLLSYLLKNHISVDNYEELLALKKTYDPMYADNVTAYDDTIELIKILSNSYRLCLASAARLNMIESALTKFELLSYFEFLLTAEDVTKGKPDPEVYLKCLEKLAINANEAVVLEDSFNGIKASRDAGIKCIGVTHTQTKDDLKEADYIVEDLMDAEKLEIFLK